MTQTESTPQSPILGFSSSTFDDDKSDTNTPYEPSPELFKKPTRTIAPESDDDEEFDDDEKKENENSEDEDDSSSENKYEEERRKKIERNKLLLANLGLANGLLPKNSPQTTKKSRRSTGSESGAEPTRRSSRLSSKAKPIYNFRELEKVEKENRKILEQEKKMKKEEQRLKYYSKRTLRKYRGEDESDEDTYVSEYNENNKRRSKRNTKKIDYADLERSSESEGEYEEFEQVTVVVEESPKKKKRVTKKSTITSPVCSFSNFTIPDDHALHFTEIGGTVAKSPTDANITHVITKEYKRTLKLMCGIIRGAYIVSEDWLFDSVENGYFVDEKPYLIKTDSVNLVKSRSRALKQLIFEDIKFCICDDVESVDILKQIIETGAGTYITDISEMLEEEYDFENCYVIYEKEETKDKYPTLPSEIFKSKEFIFSAAVAQNIEDV